MKIGYISNLELKESSGGWSGINLNIYEQLNSSFETSYIGPINPPFFNYQKAISKLNRKLGKKGAFAFFSEKRLQVIENIFQTKDSESIDAYLFLGNTPWIKIKPKKPYYVYMDADFITYLKVFSEFSKFTTKSIEKIAEQEKNWLDNAEAIFFGSNWIMQETLHNLNLTPNDGKFIVVNTGGHIPIPDRDTYAYKSDDLNLLFIALNFEKKGGRDALRVFLNVIKEFPKATLTIIGEKPPAEVLAVNGVSYLGRLSKDDPAQLKIMEEAFQNASFLIHPTKMDTMGAIIPEANYFGTPVIASNRFGIPDLIINRKTGLLIEESDDSKSVAKLIIDIFANKSAYSAMRVEARNFAVSQKSWTSIGKIISERIILSKNNEI